MKSNNLPTPEFLEKDSKVGDYHYSYLPLFLHHQIPKYLFIKYSECIDRNFAKSWFCYSFTSIRSNGCLNILVGVKLFIKTCKPKYKNCSGLKATTNLPFTFLWYYTYSSRLTLKHLNSY